MLDTNPLIFPKLSKNYIFLISPSSSYATHRRSYAEEEEFVINYNDPVSNNNFNSYNNNKDSINFDELVRSEIAQNN